MTAPGGPAAAPAGGALPEDAHWMGLALAEAEAAAAAGEVPVGAVVVCDGRLIASGQNRNRRDHDPSAHAEVVALRAAAQALGNHRLEGCTLYVTLEPCAMCGGAVLHARLARLVFGASDPRAGAAGSRLDLFAQRDLNPHTEVRGGERAPECAGLLLAFFAPKRLNPNPLREDALRTPDARFAELPGWPWTAQYLGSAELPSLQGLRMHCLDLGPRDALHTVLCLHGNPTWGYLYRRQIGPWLAAGARVVVPDLIGFGRSDKPKKPDWHSFERHRQLLLELVQALDLQRVVLVVQDWGGILGLTLPMAAPERYTALVAMNTLLATGEALSAGFLDWRAMCRQQPGYSVERLMVRACGLSAPEAAAYQAPFPDLGHRAALRAFPERVPQSPEQPGAALSRQARDFFQHQWRGQTRLLVGQRDPVLGQDAMLQLARELGAPQSPQPIAEAGHFVPEHGQALTEAVLALIG